MKTVKYLLISVLLAVFNSTANAQEAELQTALDAIKSKAGNTAKLVKAALNKNKKNPEALVNLGRALYEAKDTALARSCADMANEVVKPRYSYAPAYLLLGDIEALGNNVNKAASFYNQAIHFDPTNPIGYKKWAMAYRKISPEQAVQKLQQMKQNCPNEDVDAVAAQILSQTDDVKNAKTNTNQSTNKNDKIMELIKKGYKDPSLSKLYTNPDGEKIYKFVDEENIAFQGRACWKTEMQYLMFGDDNSMAIITAVTFDLIAPDGGHGKRVYKAGPQGEECHYILVKGIIYKWEKEDYSDLHEYLLFDSDKNVLTSMDKKLTYNLVNKDFAK